MNHKHMYVYKTALQGSIPDNMPSLPPGLYLSSAPLAGVTASKEDRDSSPSPVQVVGSVSIM